MPTNKRSDKDHPRISPIMHFTPAVVWGFFVLYFSLMPGNEVPALLADMNDKMIHALIYFSGSALIYLGFIRYNFKNAITARSVWLILFICAVAGAAIEVLQHFWVLNRNGDWQDFLANTLGSLLSVLLIRLIHGLRA